MQMQQEIMLSVRPKWCELIAKGQKTVEIRKTKPNCDVPFKVYIYCTIKGDVLCPPHLNCNKYAIHRKNNGTITGRCMTEKEKTESDYKYANGKVIGEFVCYERYPIHVPTDIQFSIDTGLWSPFSERILHDACLTPEEVIDYAGNKEDIFGWKISDLIIYDKPKQLSDFYVDDKEAITGCKHRFRWGQPESVTQHGGWIKGSYCCMKSGEPEWCDKCLKKPLVKPPQSWCYVESTK